MEWVGGFKPHKGTASSRWNFRTLDRVVRHQNPKRKVDRLGDCLLYIPCNPTRKRVAKQVNVIAATPNSENDPWASLGLEYLLLLLVLQALLFNT